MKEEKKLGNKSKTNRGDLLKFFLFITNLVVMMGITISISSSAFVILNTQYRLISIYMDIKNLESTREYNSELATSSIGETRKTFQERADAADKEIPSLQKARKSIQESSNFYVAFSAQNGVSIRMILFAFLPILSITTLWVLFFYKYNYIRVIKMQIHLGKYVQKIILNIILLDF